MVHNFIICGMDKQALKDYNFKLNDFWQCRACSGMGWFTSFFFFCLGGVRGAGFVYSPLLKDTGRVLTGLIHVTDWLPTILSVAGVKVPENKLDGYDQWKTLLYEESSPRKEILLNVDDRIWHNAALVTNGWKIVSEGDLYFIHRN